MRSGLAILAMGFILAGCEVVPSGPASTTQPIATATAPLRSAAAAEQSFNRMVARMEPVAERICAERLGNSKCDFRISVDTRANQPANAFQTVDGNGRPILVFTTALIREARNDDELAFILGHEAAHHISGHLSRTRDSAVAGAVLGGLLATLAGIDPSAIGTAQDLGATVGARRFSKDFELEADRLGTIIAFRAGYDPVRGAAYFGRIPDPGNRFLGTHPPNADRIDAVRRTMAGLR